MENKKKKRNWQLIHSNRTYTIPELAKLLGVTEWTIRYWIRKKFIAPCGTNPVKIKGTTVKEYLYNRKQRNKLHSKNEFYCVSCKKKCKIEQNHIETIYTGKKLSPTKTQIIFKAKCPNCGHQMNRFDSVKITAAREEGVSTHPFLYQHEDKRNRKENSSLRNVPNTCNWRSK